MDLIIIFALFFVHVKIKTDRYYLHIKPFFYYLNEKMYKEKKVSWFYYTQRYNKDRDPNKEYLTIKY